MTKNASSIATAVRLMRMALGLLDEAGERNAAPILQHAIDIATNAPVPGTIEEVDAFLDGEEARRLVLLVR